MKKQTWTYDRRFHLESGDEISSLTLAYHISGRLNKAKDNVVWVFHALTANSNPQEWWKGLVGEGFCFDPQQYFIICVNIPGSPYGSTVPETLQFPSFTVRDVVRAQMLLADHLGIHKIRVAIGGSFGGNQALEFACEYPGEIEHLILIASSAKESAWSIAIHEAQRLALLADLTFGRPGQGKNGLKAARAIGMLTYRTSQMFINTQTDEESKLSNFKSSSYIRYQGEKFEKRFDALAYYYLINCLDTHDVGRERGGEEMALSKLDTRTLVIGITSDVLIPVHLQQSMASNLANATYAEINSDFGHDGFLIETEQLTKIITTHLTTKNHDQRNYSRRIETTHGAR